MMDWERARALRDEIGADDFEEVVALFLDEADAAVAALADNGQAGPEALHFLKGAALNLGFAALADTCGAAEPLARQCGAVAAGPIVSLYRATRAAFLAGLQNGQIRNSANMSSLVMSR